MTILVRDDNFFQRAALSPSDMRRVEELFVAEGRDMEKACFRWSITAGCWEVYEHIELGEVVTRDCDGWT